MKHQDFAREFPNIVALYLDAVRTQGEEDTAQRNANVMIWRFGLGDSQKYTLEVIGDHYGLTRERVRQIECWLLQGLTRACSGVDADSSLPDFAAWRAQYRELCAALESAGSLVTLPMLADMLDDALEPLEGSGHLALLMAVCGYRPIQVGTAARFRGAIAPTWCRGDKCGARYLDEIYNGLNVIFDTPSAIGVTSLVAMVQRQSSMRLQSGHVRAALSSVEDIEWLADDRVQLRFDLMSTVDRAWRILHERGEPVSYKDITGEINRRMQGSARHFSPAMPRNVANQIADDDRFVPRGRSGLWFLAEWPHEKNLTIRQAAMEVLREHGQPMKLADIRRAVRVMRDDASDASISTYLCDERHFTRVAIATFALKCWGMQPVARRKRRRRAPPAIPTKRTKIKAAILQILKGHPGSQIRKADLYQMVNELEPCIRPTFYTYLSELEDERCGVRLRKKDGKYYSCYISTS